MMPIVLFYVPFPSREEAETVISTLLSEKLVGCAQLFTVQSYYTWNTKAHKEEEHPTLFKTTSQKAPLVEKRINELHSYEVPAIIQWEADVNSSYGQWLNEQLESIN